MSGCSSKSKFVYEPVVRITCCLASVDLACALYEVLWQTSQVAVLKSDGTPRCIEVSGGNLRLHSCEAFNTAGALASLTYSLAFYGIVVCKCTFSMQTDRVEMYYCRSCFCGKWHLCDESSCFSRMVHQWCYRTSSRIYYMGYW